MKKPAPDKKKTAKKNTSKSKPSYDQLVLDSLQRLPKFQPDLMPSGGLQGQAQMRYVRQFYPGNRNSPQILTDALAVTPEEVSEYLAFCHDKSDDWPQLKPDEVTELHGWQFLARKNEFWIDEAIPRSEKDRGHSLSQWHEIGVKHAPKDTGGPLMRDQWYRMLARRCFEMNAFIVEFVQILGFHEPPRPVPETVLKALKAALENQLKTQQEIIAQLRRQRVPLWVQDGKQKRLLWPEDIALISSDIAVGLQVYTVGGERFHCFDSLAELETRFAADPDLMRTSRQHMVNLRQLDRIEPEGRGRNLSFLTLPPDITARVTAAYLAAFEARLQP